MKTANASLMIYAMVILAFSILPARGFSQAPPPKTQTVSFKVYGNCKECKQRIESTALDVKGVKKAEWDVKTDILVVVGSAKMDQQQVAEAIAKAGHKSDLAPADPKGYAALPACCQYDHTEKH